MKMVSMVLLALGLSVTAFANEKQSYLVYELPFESAGGGYKKNGKAEQIVSRELSADQETVTIITQSGTQVQIKYLGIRVGKAVELVNAIDSGLSVNVADCAKPGEIVEKIPNSFEYKRLVKFDCNEIDSADPVAVDSSKLDIIDMKSEPIVRSYDSLPASAKRRG